MPAGAYGTSKQDRYTLADQGCRASLATAMPMDEKILFAPTNACLRLFGRSSEESKTSLDKGSWRCYHRIASAKDCYRHLTAVCYSCRAQQHHPPPCKARASGLDALPVRGRNRRTIGPISPGEDVWTTTTTLARVSPRVSPAWSIPCGVSCHRYYDTQWGVSGFSAWFNPAEAPG